MSSFNQKLFYAGAGFLALIASLAAITYFEGLLTGFFDPDFLIKIHPMHIILIIGSLVFAGIFLFNAAARIFTETLK